MGRTESEDVYINFHVAGLEQVRDITKSTSSTIENVGRTQIRTTKSTDKYGNEVVKTTKKMRSFRMENLSLIFGGMMMSKTFGSMTQGALELTGVTDVMNTAMNDVMITAIEPLLPMMYDFAEGIMNMSNEQKTAIGTSIMLGQVMGTVLSGMGQVLTFVDGLKEMGGLPGLFTSLKEVFGSLGSLTGKPMMTTIGFPDPEATKTSFLNFRTLAGIGLAGFTILGLLDIVDKQGKGVPVSAKDKIITLLEATAAGWLLGGWPGALVAFTIAAVIMIATDPEVKKNLQKFKDDTQEFLNNPMKNIGTKTSSYSSPNMWWLNNTQGNNASNMSYKTTAQIGKDLGVIDVKNPFGDFISRGGNISSFSPDDTIIGMKDFSQLGGGGTVINVTVQGNASRETADEIARQVDRVLNDSMKRMAR